MKGIIRQILPTTASSFFCLPLVHLSLDLQWTFYIAVQHPVDSVLPPVASATPAPTTMAYTMAPVAADTPAPDVAADTPAPVATVDTPAPVATVDTPAPVAMAYTQAPVMREESEEFEGIGIPVDLQDIILADVSSTITRTASTKLVEQTNP